MDLIWGIGVFLATLGGTYILGSVFWDLKNHEEEFRQRDRKIMVFIGFLLYTVGLVFVTYD